MNPLASGPNLYAVIRLVRHDRRVNPCRVAPAGVLKTENFKELIPLTCKQVLNDLSEYLDGELDPVLVQNLTLHLEHCEDCRIVVDTTQKTIEISCNSEPVPLPNDVVERLRRSVGKRMGWEK